MENGEQLSQIPGVLASLYPEGIYVIPEKGEKEESRVPVQKKKYLVLSNEPVTGGNMELLSGILQACKIPLQEVNINTWNGNDDYHLLMEQDGPGFVLLFGIRPEEIDLPLVFPDFQTQQFGGATWVCAPELGLLQQDKLMKSKLWLCLKQAFSL